MGSPTMKLKLSERNGINVSDERADEWIERGIRQLERSGEDYTYIYSGNRVVFVCRLKDSPATEPSHTYEVFDCTVKRNDLADVNEFGEIVNTFTELQEISELTYFPDDDFE